MAARRHTSSTVMRRTRLALVGVAAASITIAVGLLYLAWLQQTVAMRTDELARQVYAIAAGMPAGGEIDFTADAPLQLLEPARDLLEARVGGAALPEGGREDLLLDPDVAQQAGAELLVGARVDGAGPGWGVSAGGAVFAASDFRTTRRLGS